MRSILIIIILFTACSGKKKVDVENYKSEFSNWHKTVKNKTKVFCTKRQALALTSRALEYIECNSLRYKLFKLLSKEKAFYENQEIIVKEIYGIISYHGYIWIKNEPICYKFQISMNGYLDLSVIEDEYDCNYENESFSEKKIWCEDYDVNTMIIRSLIRFSDNKIIVDSCWFSLAHSS